MKILIENNRSARQQDNDVNECQWYVYILCLSFSLYYFDFVHIWQRCLQEKNLNFEHTHINIFCFILFSNYKSPALSQKSIIKYNVENKREKYSEMRIMMNKFCLQSDGIRAREFFFKLI